MFEDKVLCLCLFVTATTMRVCSSPVPKMGRRVWELQAGAEGRPTQKANLPRSWRKFSVPNSCAKDLFRFSRTGSGESCLRECPSCSITQPHALPLKYPGIIKVRGCWCPLCTMALTTAFATYWHKPLQGAGPAEVKAGECILLGAALTPKSTTANGLRPALPGSLGDSSRCARGAS